MTPRYLTLLLLSLASGSYAQEVGLASYYHEYFNGKKTACGEIYDDHKMTAAHKSLPMGTMLRVTNLENNKSVIVRVNDRGPYVKNRILDLTRAAATQLGYLQKGYTTVSYEVIDNGAAPLLKDTLPALIPVANSLFTISEIDTAEKMKYGIKLGSYEDVSQLISRSRELQATHHIKPYIQQVRLIKGALYRLFAGNYPTEEDAKIMHTTLLKTYPDSKVVKYEGWR